MAYKKTKRLSTIKERSRQMPSPRRKSTKRKYDGESNGYGMNAQLRMGHTTTRNKNQAFIRSLQPQLRLPRTTHKQNTNLLNRELNKYKPRYTFKGLGKPLGIKI